MVTALAAKNYTVYIDCLGLRNVAAAFFFCFRIMCNDDERIEFFEDINLVAIMFFHQISLLCSRFSSPVSWDDGVRVGAQQSF